jgi:hypothetical protein
MIVMSGGGKGALIAELALTRVNVGFASAVRVPAESGTRGYFSGIFGVSNTHAFVRIPFTTSVFSV